MKGISLFIVPKFLVNDDGLLGARNDVQYGDHGGAIGYLIGEENRGLEYMFIMMNAARFAVGMQGVAIAERAYQRSAAYAKERVQSRPVDGSAKEPVTIIRRAPHALDDARLH